MVFVEVGSSYILAGAQTVFSCRSVWQIFMSMQCYQCLHAFGCPAVNFWNSDWVIFALDCPFQGEENKCFKFVTRNIDQAAEFLLVDLIVGYIWCMYSGYFKTVANDMI
jgi:hypothetical protein